MAPKINLNIFKSYKLGIVLISLVAIILLTISAVKVLAEDFTITGYAWSSNIGWISFNGTGYGLSVSNTGTISGYAWSSNIGWISANSSQLTGCPSAPCTATIDSDGQFHGWLRAISGSTAQSGGWDGFISLSGSGYGPAKQSTGVVSGYAWGSDVVGWVSFSGSNYSVMTDFSTKPVADLKVRKIGDTTWVDSLTIQPGEQIELAWNQSDTTNTDYCQSVPPTFNFSTDDQKTGTDSDVEEPIGNTSRSYRLICYSPDGEQNDDSVVVSTVGGVGAKFCPNTQIDFARRDTVIDLCWELGTNDPSMCSLKAGDIVVQSPLPANGEITYQVLGEVDLKVECIGGDSQTMTVKVVPELQET